MIEKKPCNNATTWARQKPLSRRYESAADTLGRVPFYIAKQMLLLVCLFCAAILSPAQDLPPSNSTNEIPCPPAAGNLGIIAGTHHLISGRIARYATEMDVFISPTHTAPPAKGTWVKVQPKTEWEEGEGMGYGMSFAARLKLSQLEERWEVITDNLPRTRLPNKDVPLGEEENVTAGLRLNMLQRALSWISLDGGFKFNPWPAPYSRLTGSYRFRAGSFCVELTEQFFYYNQDDGFGELTQVDVTLPLSKRAMLRSTSAATWSEETDGVEWEQSLTWCRLLVPNHSELAVRASVFGHKCGAAVIDRYLANFTYRRKIYQDWCLLSVTPQIGFPRDRNFEFTPKIKLALEIYFGDSGSKSRMSMDDF